MKLKKAVSPLIATILLVVVAVILVTVVLTWGRSFATDSFSEIDTIGADPCSKAIQSLSLSNCTIVNDGNIFFQMKNISGVFEHTGKFSGEISTSTMFEAIVELEDTNSTVITGLEKGQTKMVQIDSDDLEVFTDFSDSPYQIRVVSNQCPADAYATITCN